MKAVALNAVEHTDDAPAGRVLGIRRYPLKSATGERLTGVAIGPHGLEGDRTWVCLDEDGTVGSAKHPRRWARLLDVVARFGADGVAVTVPGCEPVPAGNAEADASLSAWLGRRVRLTRTAPPRPRRHHWWPDEPGMIPEWAADAVPGQDDSVAVRDPAGNGRFYDFGTVHVVTSGALERLRSAHGAEVDSVRFRPNLVLDLPDDPEPGGLVRAGAATLEVSVPTPRCVVPSVAHGKSPADRALLRTLARHHGRDVPGFGRAACFGFYADVVQPGTVGVGDAVAV